MKKYFLMSICILGMHMILTAQNLINNPGFEILSACPTNVAQVPNATGWQFPINHQGSADYFHTCGIGIVTVPISFIGNEMPASGNGYIGLALYYSVSPDFREYVSTQLASPLMAGVTYNFEFTYSLADESQYATPDFGVYFSTGPITGNGTWNPLPLIPQAMNTTLLSQKVGWQTITLTYTAVGGEDYITFGNFKDDANTTLNTLPGTTSYDVCYLFLDDLSLTAGNQISITGDSTICIGDSTVLTAFNSSFFIWATVDSPLVTISVDSFLVASPDTTTTYIVYGATDTAYQTVYVNNLPQVWLGNDTSYCIGQVATLTANTPGATGYLWQNGSTANTYNATTTGMYIVTVTDGNCSNSDSINLIFNVCAVPTVLFGSSDTSWCEKQAIDFFDISTNNPTSWQWTFAGALPSSSTDQNPTAIYYASYGSFDVKLVACNNAGCDSLTLINFVTEHQSPPPPIITVSNDTLYASAAFAYQWFSTDSPSVVLSTNPWYYPMVPGQSFFVLISDSNGCTTPSNVVISSVAEWFATTPVMVMDNYNLMLMCNGAGPWFAEVYDIAGNRLCNIDCTGQRAASIDTRPWASAMYLVRIQHSGGVIVKKLLVSNAWR